MSEQKDTRFKKGQTGNPKGYSKARRESDGDAQVSVREYARSKDKKAIDKLEWLMDHSPNHMVQMRSAEAILARAHGQPTAHIETTSSLAEEMDKIKQRIVAGSAASQAAVVVPFPVNTNDDEDEQNAS